MTGNFAFALVPAGRNMLRLRQSSDNTGPGVFAVLFILPCLKTFGTHLGEDLRTAGTPIGRVKPTAAESRDGDRRAKAKVAQRRLRERKT
jgi:hypothetical protein